MSHLMTLSLNDVQRDGKVVVVTVGMKNNKARKFTLKNEYASIVSEYIEKRSPHVQQNRFFLNFLKGKCCNQPMGRNAILAAPKVIATFLELPQPESYTLLSFRRASATFFVSYP